MSDSTKAHDKSKPRYRSCVPPCSRYILGGDTHSMCIVCLGADHTESALRSRKALFKEGAFTSIPHRSGPASPEAEQQLHSWGSQLDLLEGMETGELLSPSSPSRSGAHSQGLEACPQFLPPRKRPQRSVFLPPRRPIWKAPHSPQYEELLEVVTRAVAKLNINWPTEKHAEPQQSKLDERFLRNRPPPSHWSLPFFPDLHTEVSRLWARPFLARLFVPTSDYYGNVAGTTESGYRAIPWVEQTLASYLSPEVASSLKAPVLPTKPLRTTSVLVGKGYSVAGQAGACLHTMAVLQAYQANLLKELDEGDETKKDDITELRRVADLSLHATKETTRAIGRSMAAMVAAERHLWLTLSDMNEKDSVFLLDAPLAPSGLFGDAVKSVLDRRRSPRQSSPDGCSTVSVSPQCPHEIIMPTLPVFQSAVVSGEPIPQSLLLRQRSGAGELATPAGVSRTVSSRPVSRDYLAAWKLLPNVSARVLRTVEQGYRIQFGAPPPPFSGVFPTLAGPEQGLVMEQEVDTLLRKDAIEVVPPHDRESGFYRQYFIVPKKDGGLRPILDLRQLNRSLMWLEFRMLTVSQVVSQIRSEDWFVTIDLKDAYFHVSILPRHRKFLRFAFRGRSIPVSGSSVRPSTLPPHFHEITTYLGVVWDSTTMRARLSPARIKSILTAVVRVKEGRSLTVKQFQRLLGLMAAASLQLRPLQWWLRTKGFSTRGNPFRMIKVTWRCLRALDMWKKPWFLSQGPVLGALCRCVTLATNASLTGWGAVMDGHPVRGLWSGRHLTWHINCLEMLAVFQALKHFLPDPIGRHGLLHQPPGRSAFAPLIQAGAPDPCVLPGQTLLTESSSCSWASQHGSRHPVEAGADARGIHASPEVQADLESVWPGSGGPLHDSGECAMSPLVLSDSSSSPGAGCHGTNMAEASSVSLSPDRSAPGGSGESAPGRGPFSFSSPVLAGPSMVLGPDFPSRWLSMGDSRQEGPPLSGGGHHPPPSLGAVEVMGVASEGAHLVASGLSTKVVETILQSRAPSTRKLYALKCTCPEACVKSVQ
ncbi:hypothetical protein M9458_055704 [Cirrhinus mrigala]|uniref:Reverse transcriptase domain-containing protein n=1 Tax=Cirrhinus mrigala TaxID=683832 RepID=A0ABD0MGX8_CIRMR